MESLLQIFTLPRSILRFLFLVFWIPPGPPQYPQTISPPQRRHLTLPPAYYPILLLDPPVIPLSHNTTFPGYPYANWTYLYADLTCTRKGHTSSEDHFWLFLIFLPVIISLVAFLLFVRRVARRRLKQVVRTSVLDLPASREVDNLLVQDVLSYSTGHIAINEAQFVEAPDLVLDVAYEPLPAVDFEDPENKAEYADSSTSTIVCTVTSLAVHDVGVVDIPPAADSDRTGAGIAIDTPLRPAQECSLPPGVGIPAGMAERTPPEVELDKTTDIASTAAATSNAIVGPVSPTDSGGAAQGSSSSKVDPLAPSEETPLDVFPIDAVSSNADPELSHSPTAGSDVSILEDGEHSVEMSDIASDAMNSPTRSKEELSAALDITIPVVTSPAESVPMTVEHIQEDFESPSIDIEEAILGSNTVTVLIDPSPRRASHQNQLDSAVSDAVETAEPTVLSTAGPTEEISDIASDDSVTILSDDDDQPKSPVSPILVLSEPSTSAQESSVSPFTEAIETSLGVIAEDADKSNLQVLERQSLSVSGFPSETTADSSSFVVVDDNELDPTIAASVEWDAPSETAAEPPVDEVGKVVLIALASAPVSDVDEPESLVSRTSHSDENAAVDESDGVHEASVENSPVTRSNVSFGTSTESAAIAFAPLEDTENELQLVLSATTQPVMPIIQSIDEYTEQTTEAQAPLTFADLASDTSLVPIPDVAPSDDEVLPAVPIVVEAGSSLIVLPVGPADAVSHAVHETSPASATSIVEEIGLAPPSITPSSADSLAEFSVDTSDALDEQTANAKRDGSFGLPIDPVVHFLEPVKSSEDHDSNLQDTLFGPESVLDASVESMLHPASDDNAAEPAASSTDGTATPVSELAVVIDIPSPSVSSHNDSANSSVFAAVEYGPSSTLPAGPAEITAAADVPLSITRDDAEETSVESPFVPDMVLDALAIDPPEGADASLDLVPVPTDVSAGDDRAAAIVELSTKPTVEVDTVTPGPIHDYIDHEELVKENPASVPPLVVASSIDSAPPATSESDGIESTLSTGIESGMTSPAVELPPDSSEAHAMSPRDSSGLTDNRTESKEAAMTIVSSPKTPTTPVETVPCGEVVPRNTGDESVDTRVSTIVIAPQPYEEPIPPHPVDDDSDATQEKTEDYPDDLHAMDSTTTEPVSSSVVFVEAEKKPFEQIIDSLSLAVAGDASRAPKTPTSDSVEASHDLTNKIIASSNVPSGMADSWIVVPPEENTSAERVIAALAEHIPTSLTAIPEDTADEYADKEKMMEDVLEPTKEPVAMSIEVLSPSPSVATSPRTGQGELVISATSKSLETFVQSPVAPPEEVSESVQAFVSTYENNHSDQSQAGSEESMSSSNSN